MTLRATLRAAAVRLDAVAETGRLDAHVLLEHVAGVDAAALVRDDAPELSAEQAQRFEDLVARRLTGVPIAYLVGTVGFYGRTFAVDERVLIPRPETEHVVEAALDDLRGRGKTRGRVADIGTGSGAIAVTIATELPECDVFATESSTAALSVARANAARNRVAQHCTFLRGDLAEPLRRFAPFDAVVANLPYIPRAEVPSPPHPVGYEPQLALDGGPDGLRLYVRLLAQLPPLVAFDATVFFEAAPGTIERLAALVQATFARAHVEIGEDYAGLERFVQFSL